MNKSLGDIDKKIFRQELNLVSNAPKTSACSAQPGVETIPRQE
jgi:hypothetical protein